MARGGGLGVGGRSRRDLDAISARSRRDLACISSAPYALTGLIAAATSASSSFGDPHAGGGGRYERCLRAVFGLCAPLPVSAHSMSPLAMPELYLLGGGSYCWGGRKEGDI